MAAVTIMKVKLNLAPLRETQWHDYAARFVIGGAITVVAGLIAKRFGPTVGGLFLAFPAIFPASATLIEKHENEKKEQAGVGIGHRGQDAAALDAAGAAMGSIALVAFAVIVWRFLPRHALWNVLLGSTVIWLLVSVLIWRMFEDV